MAKTKKQSREVKQYAGVLAEPVRLKRKASRRSSPNDGLEFEPVDTDVLWDRVEALFEHYEVGSNDWTTLCMRMAQQHVPGFQIITESEVPKPPWGIQDEFDLWFDVETLRRSKVRVSLSRAFTILATRERWKLFTDSALRRKYQSAKDSPLPTLFRYINDSLGWERAVSNMTEFGFIKSAAVTRSG